MRRRPFGGMRAGLGVALTLAITSLAAGQAPPARTAPAAAPGVPAAAPKTLAAAIDDLGKLDYAVRTAASAAVRRAPAEQAVPALMSAVASHGDGYVRFRALVLLAGIGDPRTRDVMIPAIDDVNDRLREVAYAWLEFNPEPSLAPKLIAKLETEVSEFVRPSLVRALAALGSDAAVRAALLKDVTRGEDVFRSAVIEALGLHKATYAVGALSAVASLDGPLQDDAVVALARIGDPKGLDIVIAQQGKAPRPRQPALAAAICLLGRNCESHERFLNETLTFTTKNMGHQELARSAADALGVLARSGRATAWDTLIAIGDPRSIPCARRLRSRWPPPPSVASRRPSSPRSSAPPIPRPRCCSSATASTCCPRIWPRSASTRASAPSTGRPPRARRRAPASSG